LPFTVALERSVEDVRALIEAVGPTHPSVIDTDHRLAELYHLINVPTILWIDERGRICRPHDAQFGTDTFSEFTRKASAPYLDMIRAWVRTGEGALEPDGVRAHQPMPSADSQLARAERALAWHLTQRGRDEAAARHYGAAGKLAPTDWTIRRGSLRMQGHDPFGAEFFALFEDGVPVYSMEAQTPTKIESKD